MDRFTQRLKKEISVKSTPNEKYVFIRDVKSIKESLKIKEILRTVKINSSMRLKAPRGSKIMSNKDFNEEDCFEESVGNQISNEPLSASNPDVIVLELEKNNESVEKDISPISNSEQDAKGVSTIEHENNAQIGNIPLTKIELTETGDAVPDNDVDPDNEVVPDTEFVPNNEVVPDKLERKENNNELSTAINILPSIKTEKVWDRKLSLDQSMLSRGQGFSQSELDLHSMGRSPIERKVSFFRKKMDSFVRNTTELFKRQNSPLQRRGSMSVSLHSLNEQSNFKLQNEPQATNGQEPLSTSRTSIQTSSSIARSNSSLSMIQSRLSCAASEHNLAGSQPALHAHSGSGSTLEGIHSNSVHSLNEEYLKEAMLNSRAISMSSGLDSPLGQSRRKANRSNRVTWVASEGLTNYFRRLIQDEKSKELQSCRSYQDFSSIPENELYNRQPETRGRKLSYTRAVSGEDPALQTRSQDSSIRRKHHTSENNEAAMTSILEDFNRNGVPKLEGFDMALLSDDTFTYLQMALQKTDIENFYDWKSMDPDDESRQTVIKEMIYTEAEYINHLMAIVNVFIGAAHALQDKGYLLNIDTSKLFSNLPDILNANLYFWHFTFLPMMRRAFKNTQPFDAQMMVEGFSLFRDLVIPYEIFLADQTKLLEYSRKSQKDPEFALYLTWCHARKECNRLQLIDFIVKPMQRLTKYGLLLNRIVHYTRDKKEQIVLESMEQVNTSTLVDINRSVRYRQEMEVIANLQDNLENLDCEIKDVQVESLYNSYGKLNLSAPMLYCIPDFPRTVIHQADVRFRDATKEIDCRVFLLTDMLIFCRKFSRGYPYKLIRPRYMIDKLVQINKTVSRNSSDASLVFAVLDDLGTAYTSFTISEPSKDPNPNLTLKTIATKLMEARYTYEIVIWLSKHQTRDLTLLGVDLKAEFAHYKKTRSTADEQVIEQDARERVITMLNKNMGAKHDTNVMTTPPFYTLDTLVMGVSARPPGRNNMPRFVHRTSKAAASFRSKWVTPQRSSTLSLQEPATSGTPVPRPSGSVEYLQPPPIVTGPAPSVTVKVITEDSESVAPQQVKEQPTPSPSKASVCSTNTLQVQDQKDGVATLIHSLPDLTIEPSTPRSTSSPTHPIRLSASSKLYKSHQQLLQRQKLATAQGQQYLSPDNRGSSYPPPSPTRGSLKRGLAFSYSFKNPPLHKMGHVASQSTTQPDSVASTSQQVERASSPKPSTSTEKSDKKTKLSSSRRKRRDKSEDRHSEPCTSRRDESPDPFRRDESPSPSYRDESPGTSYRDESTDLSGIDRSSSLSHRDESPGTSCRGESPAYREFRRGSSGRDKSLDRSQADESPDLKSVEMSLGSSKDKSPDRYRDSSGSDRHKDMSPSPSRGSASPDPAQRKKSFSSKAVSLSPIASTDEIPGLSIGESSRSSLKEDQSQKRDKSPSGRLTDDSWESDSTERLEKKITILRPTRDQTPGPSRRIRSLSPVVVCEVPTFYQGESSSNIIESSAAPSRIQDVPSTSHIQDFFSSSFRQRTKDIRKSFLRRLRRNEEAALKPKVDSFCSDPKSEELESNSKSPTSSSKSKKSETGRRRWFRRF